MKILADCNIPYVYDLFGLIDQVKLCDGRHISSKDIKNADILIVRSVTKVDQLLLYDCSVKFVGTVTSGIDHIDLDYLNKNCIKCVSAPGSNSIAVVEYVFTALFWLSKRDRFFLRDKTVGIIGVGNIGYLLYKRLNDFGVNTVLYDPYISQRNINEPWKSSLEKLISESDIVTLHTPLTYIGNHPTWHMIDKYILDALPSGCILINTSRGSVIDNVALLKVLQKGKKINVVLDVWESEPRISLPLLFCVDIGTPHIAGYTYESKIRSIVTVYNVYCDYFNIKHIINMSYLLPKVISFIQIKNVDEVEIGKLISMIYNIHHDHNLLKVYSVKLDGFSKLRMHYCFRREWSSVYIKNKKDSYIEILNNLGFNIL